MSLMFQPLVKYAEFGGRARRSEYWLFQLLCVLIWLGSMLILAMTGGLASSNGDAGASGGAAAIVLLLMMLASLALLIPGIAVTIRRLHDINKPAAWILIAFVPIIGGLVLLIFMLTDGTQGTNPYGPDPKNRAPFVPPGPVEVHHYHHDTPQAGPTPAGPDATV